VGRAYADGLDIEQCPDIRVRMGTTMDSEYDLPRLDRRAFSVVSLEEQDEDEMRYWRTKTPHERLQALEVTRRILYGYDPATSRLQRVLEVVDRA
jgi:hypothetical protein